MLKHKAKFQHGDPVSWDWGNGMAYGTVEEMFTEKTTRKINGKDVTRNATEDEPAYLLKHEDGQTVLKSESELHHVN